MARREEFHAKIAKGSRNPLWLNREYSVPSNDVLEITHKYRVTACDGEFVVLAKELGGSLVPFDKAV